MNGSNASTALSTLTPEQTARALEDAAVTCWWQTTAIVEIAGPDALTLLDGLCTQAVERITPGHAVLGLFLDTKAKVIAPAILHRAPDTEWTNPRNQTLETSAPRIFLETPAHLASALAAHITRYRLRARVTIDAAEVSTVALVGATADAYEPAADACIVATKVHGAALPTRVFITAPERSSQLVESLSALPGGGLADPGTVEAARISNGVAGLHDLLPGRMPAEIGGMETAVALDAGCYLGQEPVARLHYRGHANRTLRRLESVGSITPAAPTDDAPDAPFELRLVDADPGSRAKGRLTTWAATPDGRTVALAVLRREIEAGTPLLLAGTGEELIVVDSAPATSDAAK